MATQIRAPWTNLEVNGIKTFRFLTVCLGNIPRRNVFTPNSPIEEAVYRVSCATNTELASVER